ncbi:hypothetical protein [Citrobacter pasteurii]|nr:hypothetical protein [Citrobacter pasteurii]
MKLDRFGEIEGVLFAKVPMVPEADVPVDITPVMSGDLQGMLLK